MEEASQATEATTTTSSDVGGGEGSPNPLAFDVTNLPDGLDREPSLRNFDSVDKLAKSYVHAVKKMGVPPEQMLRLPTGDDDGWDDVYNALGRPENPQGYNFGEIDDSDDLSDFKNYAHEIGLTQRQAESLLDKIAEGNQTAMQQRQEGIEQAEADAQAALTREWGQKYNENLDYARRAFGRFASPEALQVMEETGLGNHPEILKLFAKVGEQLSEEQMLPGNPRGSGMAPGEIEAQIASKRADPEFKTALMNAAHPNHKSAVAEMNRLYDRLPQVPVE